MTQTQRIKIMSIVVILHSLCLLLPSLPFLVAAQTYRNISLGSSLTAKDGGGSTWVSPSREFAFGFKQIQNQGFLLAIWFDKIPEKTVVWSANGDQLVQRGSKVVLSEQSQLVLNNPQGHTIWSPNLTTSAEASPEYAAMLDTGNFILAVTEGGSLWESFDHPTDTVLPTQRIKPGTNLVARFSETNYSNGKFMFTLDPTGPSLSTLSFPTTSVNKKYWSLAANDSNLEVVFNQSGDVYLAAIDGSISQNILSGGGLTRDAYRRAILEYDGVFREYVYLKSGKPGINLESTNWSTSSFKPADICMEITEDTGGGVCGFNGYCTMGGDKRPLCKCPPGFLPLDPDNKMSGCRQNFTSHNCEEQGSDQSFELQVMDNIDWPLSDYEHFVDVDEKWCSQACLGDCFCGIAIYKTDECWKKKIPLSNGRLDSSVDRRAFIKVGKNNTSNQNPPVVGKRHNEKSALTIIGAVLLSSSVFLNFLLLVVTCLFISHNNRKALQPLHLHNVGKNLQSFTYEELERATNGFREKLGSGAYSTVYKGDLAHATESHIAVKRMHMAMGGGTNEFEAEIGAISQTNHKNLVQLLGFCNEGQHQLLVYEFMPNCSLAELLFGESKPAWYQRIQIALGTARGILYLHEECSRQMIHCDVKPQNILLDNSMEAKICDFGLAKLLNMNQTHTFTDIRGTKGYVAPEWFRTVPISVKVDVYSFGVVLLELIFCRRNFDPGSSDENQMVLADWALDYYSKEELQELLKDDKDAMDNITKVEKFVMIAIWCIQGDPLQRPSMRKVVQMLEGAVEVPAPPDPYTSSTFIDI